MHTRAMKRLVSALATTAAVVALAAGPAAADPPGPTDYRTDIVALEPPTAAVQVAVIGGDSFLRLSAAAGTEVDVVGYRGEPYLRFGADGTVERNERAPTRWLNDNRYASVQLPSIADPQAEPDWRVVSSGGSYLWHDHRSHWMGTAPPPGASPGDVVLEAVVPLVVNGRPVALSVRSTMLAPPSPWPAVLGTVVAVCLAVAAVITAGRRALAGAVALWAVAAAVIGAWTFSSVPSQAGPSILLWAPPTIAAVLAAAVAVPTGVTSRPPMSSVLLGSAGLELLWWGVLRRVDLIRAALPSSAPAGLDRAVVAGSLVVAAASLVAAGLEPVRRWRAASRQKVGN